MTTTILTTIEAAELTGYTRQNIAHACKKGTLRATKFGRDWHIKRTDLDKWLAAPKDRGGRPRKRQE